MLQLQDLTYFIGGTPLFKQITCVINPADRIGLVGPNGAGKSTLLKILNGNLEPESGSIHKMGDCTVGYLPQDGVSVEVDRTVYEEVEQSLSSYRTLFDAYEEAQEDLNRFQAGSKEHDRALERFGKLQEKLERTGAWGIQSEVKATLSGLGFGEEEMEQPASEFSGGWLMRIALAKLLIQKPNVLLLDEPTNHLDIGSLEWLEQFLQQYPGAIVVVSHDRAFLNNLTTRTFHLSRKSLDEYSGNYAFFEKKAEERREQITREYENQQKEIKQIQEFIDRFRYKADKAGMVQSRIKQLEKMEKIEPEEAMGEISFEFRPPPRSGAVVVACEDLHKSYGDHVVYAGLDLKVERGDRIAIVGPNGAGKSTLLKIIAGQEMPSDGAVNLGHNVSFSYFAQHQVEELDVQNTLLEEIQDGAGNQRESYLRSVLGCFLFTGDDVFKKVGVLSGGEKSRVALAKMMIREANLLLMDEPTNHLDMRSKEILQEALRSYTGTFVIVSHDRDFLDPLVNKTIEIDYDRTRTFHGNVSYYLRKKHELDGDGDGDGSTSGSNSSPTQSAERQKESDAKPKISRAEERRMEAERRQEKSNLLKPIKKQMAPVEKKIQQIESRIEELEAIMAEPDFYQRGDEVAEISREYDKQKERLDAQYYKWEQLAEEAEKIEEQFA